MGTLKTISVSTVTCNNGTLFFHKMGYYRPPFDMSFLKEKLDSSQTSSGKSFVDMGRHKILDPFKYPYDYVQEDSDYNFLTNVNRGEILCRQSGRDKRKGFEIVLLNNDKNPTQIFVSKVLYLKDIQCCTKEQYRRCIQ